MEKTPKVPKTTVTTDKPADAYFIKRVRKDFWAYWLYDRLFRTSILLILSLSLVLVELFFTVGDGIITNEGWMVHLVALSVCTLICCFWKSFRDQEISLVYDTEVYTDLQRYEMNSSCVGPFCCLTKAILQTYYPTNSWPIIAWGVTMSFIMAVCYEWRNGIPTNMVVWIVMWVLGLEICWLVRRAVIKWIKPKITQLSTRR